jgi:hypothetical protein
MVLLPALNQWATLVLRHGLTFGCHGFGTPNPCRAVLNLTQVRSTEPVAPEKLAVTRH